METELRVYASDELGKDGYPVRWHRAENGFPALKELVRMAADYRCVRCGHPYRSGEHGSGEWSPCDEQCSHLCPVRWVYDSGDHEPIIFELPDSRTNYV